VRIGRVGFTPLKGARHRDQGTVELTAPGPVGDRVFCLFDPAADRCLRTVENPALLRTEATWRSGVLSVSLPSGTVEGKPVPTGELRMVDYWGRTAKVEVVDGPWAEAYSTHLGREVLLARAEPGQVVYGGSVSLVTSASLALLGERLGRPAVEAARFRATLEVDTGDLPAHVEDDWVGRTLHVGPARLRVLGAVPRCAVIDLDPDSGVRNGALMQALAGYRQGVGEVTFGVDAEVVTAGRVATGDRVELGED
jgi:MOSC domain-containing protein